jgi:hypothetical protein
MTMLPLLTGIAGVKHATNQGDLKFAVIGDGKPGNANFSAPGVNRAYNNVNIYRFTAFAQNLDTGRLVYATQDASKPFVNSDSRGQEFIAGNVPVAFSGIVERLHWVGELNMFLAQASVDANFALLEGGADGMNWTPYFSEIGYRKVPSGFAFNPGLNVAICALNGPDVLVKNITGWHAVNTGDAGGYSLVYYPPLNRFIGYRPGSQVPKQTTNGDDWTDYMYNLPVPCGTAAGPYSLYLVPMEDDEFRLLLFTIGGVAPAWYSDDHGQNWTACSGMDNTGSVTRYVAVDGNALYVAFNANLNKGMVSRDYGQTWERSDHLSGNASGVIALN